MPISSKWLFEAWDRMMAARRKPTPTPQATTPDGTYELTKLLMVVKNQRAYLQATVIGGPLHSAELQFPLYESVLLASETQFKAVFGEDYATRVM